MARFNLEDYETVEERIKRFYGLHEDGRIITQCHIAGDNGRWLFSAEVFLTAGDQANGLPKARGFASEQEQGPQANWAAELSETSAIGRALANMNLSGNKRATRQEMEKVARVETPTRDYVAEAEKISTKEDAYALYKEAKAKSQPKEVLDLIAEKARAIK